MGSHFAQITYKLNYSLNWRSILVRLLHLLLSVFFILKLSFQPLSYKFSRFDNCNITSIYNEIMKLLHDIKCFFYQRTYLLLRISIRIKKNRTEVEKFSFIIMCGEVVSSFVSNVLLNEPLIFKLLSSHLTVKLRF